MCSRIVTIESKNCSFGNFIKNLPDVAWKPITIPIPIPNFNWSFGHSWSYQPYSVVAASSGTATAPRKATAKVAEVVEEEEEEEEPVKDDPIEPSTAFELPVEPIAVDSRQAVPVHGINYQLNVVKKFGK